jgi:hypothetical protein
MHRRLCDFCGSQLLGEHCLGSDWNVHVAQTIRNSSSNVKARKQIRALSSAVNVVHCDPCSGIKLETFSSNIIRYHSVGKDKGNFCTPIISGYPWTTLEVAVRPSVSLSVRPHGTTRLPLEGFSWNLIFHYFSKICRENSISIKICQE